VPVVLEFHGHGSNAFQQIVYGNFAPHADTDGFVVVAPEGQGTPRHFTLLAPGPGEEDDVVFVADLIAHLQQTMCIDPARVYATGMSNGGALSAILACRLSDRIAAFGSVAAVVWGPQCEGARTLPIVAFHGTADKTVPFNGGRVSCCGNPVIPPAPETMANWARHDGCTSSVDEPVKGTVSVRRWSGCKPGGAVAFYIVGGGGHTWPGAAFSVGSPSETTHDVDAAKVIWEFFKGYRLAGS
jgi:polyhydroxybutyrate depolymerase